MLIRMVKNGRRQGGYGKGGVILCINGKGKRKELRQCVCM